MSVPSTLVPTVEQMQQFEALSPSPSPNSYTAGTNGALKINDADDGWATVALFAGEQIATREADYITVGQPLTMTIYPPDNKYNPHAPPVGTILVPVSPKNAKFLEAERERMIEAYAAADKLHGQFSPANKKAFDKAEDRMAFVRGLFDSGTIRLPWSINPDTDKMQFKLKLPAVKPGAQTPDDRALGEKLSASVGTWLAENSDYIYNGPTVTDPHGDTVDLGSLFDRENPHRPIKAFGKVECGYRIGPPKKDKQSIAFSMTFIKGIQLVAVEESRREAKAADVSSIFGVEKRPADAAEIFGDGKRTRAD